MQFATYLDRRIFQSIRGSTPEYPQTLAGIINWIDASERLIPTYEDISGGLDRLIETGQIAETATHCFCEQSNVRPSKTFSGVTESDYATAVAEYVSWSERIRNESSRRARSADDFVGHILTLVWSTLNDRWPTDEDQDAAAKLSDAIAPILTQSGLAYVNGYAHGGGPRGCYIGILIFGKPTDSNVDHIYSLLAPLFRKFNCPQGSRIIRRYSDGKREIESDVVNRKSRMRTFLKALLLRSRSSTHNM